MKQHFLIEVQFDEPTRMLMGDAKVRRHLEVIVESFFRTWSSGPVPAVTIHQGNLKALWEKLVEETHS